MINDLKLGIQMLRYTYGKTGAIVGMAVCGIMGFIFYLLEEDGFFGGFFLILTSMWVVQMLYSLSVSNMVLASPLRKKMQVSVPAILNCAGMAVTYTVLLLIEAVRVILHPERIAVICNGLVSLVLVMIVLMVYMAFVYKYFVVSTLIFYVAYFSCYIGRGWISTLNLWNFDHGNGIGNFVIAVLIGYAAIAVGGYLQYIASLLICRKPMSKISQPAALRKNL